MAARVFVSSTCYDLADLRSTVRQELERSGHEVILSEDHDVAYDPDLHTQMACVDAVDDANVLVAIVAGRLGSKLVEASEMLNRLSPLADSLGPLLEFAEKFVPSATQAEQIQAHIKGIPIIMCVRASVWTERNLYKRNAGKVVIEYPAIAKQDDAEQIFEFINAIQAMPKGNGIITFETASELQGHVQKQLSGLLAASLKRVSALATSTDDDDGALDAAAKLSEALSARGWEHAFGGRLARASLGASLAFTEIDLTVFLDPQDAGQDLLDLAAELGLEAGGVTAETVASAEQLRTRWNGRSVDFFLGVDGFRSESRERVIHEVVGGVNLPVLCLEDQLVLAAVTNNVFPELLDFASVRSHDTAYVQRWIAELKGG